MNEASNPSSDARCRFLDDVQVGDRFVSAWHETTRAEMVDFARSFDPQPMHLDEEAARDSMFGELIASGWYTLSLSMRLIVDSRPFGATSIVGVAVDGIRFTRAVTPGTRLSAAAEITAIRRSTSDPTRGYVDFALETSDDHGRVVLRQRWTVLVPVKPT